MSETTAETASETVFAKLQKGFEDSVVSKFVNEHLPSLADDANNVGQAYSSAANSGDAGEAFIDNASEIVGNYETGLFIGSIVDDAVAAAVTTFALPEIGLAIIGVATVVVASYALTQATKIVLNDLSAYGFGNSADAAAFIDNQFSAFQGVYDNIVMSTNSLIDQLAEAGNGKALPIDEYGSYLQSYATSVGDSASSAVTTVLSEEGLPALGSGPDIQDGLSAIDDLVVSAADSVQPDPTTGQYPGDAATEFSQYISSNEGGESSDAETALQQASSPDASQTLADGLSVEPGESGVSISGDAPSPNGTDATTVFTYAADGSVTGETITYAGGASITETFDPTSGAMTTFMATGPLTIDEDVYADSITFTGSIMSTGTLQGQSLHVNSVTAVSTGVIAVDTIAGGGLLENDGVIVASTSGLSIDSLINNDAGTLLDSGPVSLDGGSFSGGVLQTTVGNAIQVGLGTIDGSAESVTIDGLVQVGDGNLLHLLGDIVNDGTISLDGTDFGATVSLDTAVVTVSGTGSIDLSDRTFNYIEGGIYAGPDHTTSEVELVLENTIAGAGIVSVEVANHGLIEADSSDSTLTFGESISNVGLIEATSGATLVLSNAVSNSGGTISASSSSTVQVSGAITNADGTIAAVGPGAIVALEEGLLSPGAVINGGLLATASGGIIQIIGGFPQAVTFDGSSDPVVIKGEVLVSAPVSPQTGAGLALKGVVENDGTILDESSVTVSGEQASLTGTGILSVSSDISGNGSQSLANASTISGNGLITGLSLENSGTIDASVAGSTLALYLNAANNTANTGVLQASAGTLLLENGSITNTGIIRADGGTVTISDGVEGPGTFGISAGGTLSLENSDSASAYVFYGPGTLLLPSDPMVEGLVGFGDGDKIDVFISAFQSTSEVVALENGTLSLNDGRVEFDLRFQGLADGTLFDVAPDGSLYSSITLAGSAPCFCRGTLIRTPSGDVRVESLSVGDEVLTYEGAVKSICWIGRRGIAVARHSCPANVNPYRIRSGAFAPNQPEQDLFISPDHAVYAEDVLIPVKYLENGTTVVQEKVDWVSYFHIELADHDVIFANGLAVESYLDSGDRASFAHPENVVIDLHTKFGNGAQDFSLLADAMGYAPLQVCGTQVERVRARLMERVQNVSYQNDSYSGAGVLRTVIN
jgi:hypothetical protein